MTVPEQVQPRSVRPISEAWVGGVCAGLADHLGWSVLVLRVLFVVLGALGLLAVDLAWRGPDPALTIAASADDCWAMVGRRRTRVRLVDGRHPETLGAG